MKNLIPLIGNIAGVLHDAHPVPSPKPALLTGASAADVDSTAARISSICVAFGIDVTPLEPSMRAARFCRYLIDPGPDFATNQLSSLALDLQVRLGLDLSPMIRIEKNKLVIEVARHDRKDVLFEHVRNQLPRTDASSRVPIGVDQLGSLKFADLAVPGTGHIVVAGSPGSGKTQWLRMAMAGLALQNTDRSLRFAFLESRGPSLLGLDDTLALWSSESPSSRTVSPLNLLDALIREMESRRRIMLSEGVEDWSQLAPKHRLSWPRIICVCDEYADLAQPRRNFPQLDSRILSVAARGSGAGLHLILASRRINSESMEIFSQQPSFCKVVLRLLTPTESRQWLGIAGAENLLGEGDLFFQHSGSPSRLQAPLMGPGEPGEVFASGVLCA
jgi:DNA segregation ATPase FtsK/SpoIIIE-like protein